MWGFCFVQKKFHGVSPGDSESMFLEARDSETQEGLKVEEARSEQQEGASPGLPGLGKGSLSGGSEPCWAVWTQERKLQKQKEGLWRQAQGSGHNEPLLPLFPWLQVSWEPLEFRRKRAKIPASAQASSGGSMHYV